MLYAYPAALTTGCTTQACDFRDSLDALHSAGITVVGISQDDPAKLAEFREHDALTYPLVGDPTRETLIAYGAYGEKQLSGKTVNGVIRSTFIIDTHGVIEQGDVRRQGRRPRRQAPPRPRPLIPGSWSSLR